MPYPLRAGSRRSSPRSEGLGEAEPTDGDGVHREGAVDRVLEQDSDVKNVAIEIQGLKKSFATRRGSVSAIDRMDLMIRENEFMCLLGPSGCGKTTMLRCLAGLERPDAGRIVVGNEVVFDSERRQYVPTEKRGLGMVFQSYAIWPHMSVFENVAFPLRRGSRRKIISADEVRERVRKILEVVDCSALENRSPGELSGGQQQRVALARALVYSPKILLFDEPLSNLDAKLRERMRSELRMIQEQVGFTAVYVTHDQEEALTMSDRIVVMAAGRIRQIGTPNEVYERPVDGFVADFLGAANVLSVTSNPSATSDVADTDLGQVWFGSRSEMVEEAGAALEVVVRPERVELVDYEGHGGRNMYCGVVAASAYHGDAMSYTVAVNGVQLRVVDRSERRARIGEDVWVHIHPEHCRLVAGIGAAARRA